MKGRKVIRNGLLGLLGLIAVILVALQVVLNEKVLTRIVNRVGNEYVDGDLVFSRVKANVLKSFPYLDVRIDSCALTYPHDKFAAYDSLDTSSRRFSLVKAGRGESVDTLASFRRLEVALNYMNLVKGGEINIRRVELERPRIFAHYYDSTAANWNILPIGSDEEEEQPEDSVRKPLPAISVHRIALTDRPFIVFTDPADTIHALVTMRRMVLDGKVHTREWDEIRGRFEVDTLFVSGRLPSDTLSLGLDRLELEGKDRAFSLSARAKAFLATHAFGRMRIPIGLDAEGELPEREDGSLEVRLDRLGLDVSALHLDGNGDVVLHPDRKSILADVTVDRAPLGDLIREYDRNLPVLRKVKTDAVLSLDAHVEGDYAEGRYPSVNAHLSVPPSRLDYEGIPRLGRLELEADAKTDSDMRLDVRLSKFLFDFVGARADLVASAEDLLGDDPLFSLDGKVRARIDSLTRAFTSERGISGTGALKADLHGTARLSDLDMVHIGNADIHCDMTADDLRIDDAPDSLQAYIRKADIALETTGNTLDKNIRRGARVLRLKAAMDTLDVTWKDDIFARGGDILLLAQNSADILKGGKKLTPLMGLLKFDRLGLRDSDGLAVFLRSNKETFRITPATKERPTPRLSLTSDSERLFVRQSGNAYALRNFKFDAAASRRVPRKRNGARRTHLLDSLQRVYPGVPRDSLFSYLRSRRQTDDFADKDIQISLSKALRQYYRDWEFDGNLDLASARIMLPSLPIKTYVKDARGSFNNDRIDLKNVTLNAGASDLSAEASLSGLRRAIFRRGILNLDAKVTSDYLDANELMRAYAYYSTWEPPKENRETSEEEAERMSDSAELPDSTGSRLIVLPSNLNVNLILEASGIKYDSLQVNWAAADIAMRDRTLQVTNALAASNMGDIYFEGFYSTRNRQDLKAGFDLNLVDITAEKVITLFPAVDTIMPMLKSFAGDLDCELAATADVDTAMNVILPTVDGIMKISGKDLSLSGDSKEFKKIAKYLLFRNKKEARIDKMSVTGMIRDNTLEVFPFVLDVDRYLLAASGIQHLDSSFDYHISVIRSPLLLKFGINAWGPDFSHVKIGLGKARYKNANVPVFTKQLETVQYSLLSSIHNIFDIGVEKAIAENREQQVLESRANEVSVHRAPTDTAGATEAVLDTLQNSEDFTGDIQERVASKREQLRKEVLELSEKAAGELEKKDE